MTSDSRDSKTELKINLPPVEERELDASYLFQPYDKFSSRSTLPHIIRTTFNRYDFAIIISAFILALGSVLLTISAVGFSWDEAYYYEPAKSAVSWLKEFLSNPVTAARKDSINYAFAEVNELPALSKFALGLSQRLFADVFGEFYSMRVAPATAYALALVLIYLIGFNVGGRIVALASMGLYGLMPRVFGHAHIAATESLANFTILLTTWLFLKSIDSNRTLWAILCAIAGGLALATRINCLLMFPVLIIVGYVYWHERAIKPLFYLIIVSPLVMILASPWFWHNTILRVLEYFIFFATHKSTAVFYLGVKYVPGGPLVPWHYPWVISAITLPEVSLLFIVLGLIISLFSLHREKVALILAMALVSLIIVTLPGSPKYDGERLFLPAFPFLAILGGCGLFHVSKFLGELVTAKPSTAHRFIKYFATILIIFVFGNGLWTTIDYYPFHLSYFNSLIGGLSGANQAGMEVTYWGEAVNKDVINYLNENLPPGAKLKLLALHDKVFELLQRENILRADIQLNTPPPYDYHLLLVRKGFFARPERYLYEYWRPMKVFLFKRTPLVVLYKTGPAFEQEWIKLKPEG